MTNQVISAEAVAAARVAVRAAMIEFGPDGHTDGDEEITRAALEAAAPHLMAAAWDECEAAKYEIRLSTDGSAWEPVKPNPYRAHE